jgi:hypothetical protein
MIIIHEATLAHSKAFIFVFDEWVKLLKAGHGDNELTFGNAAKVCYAISDSGAIMGAAVWQYDATRRAVTVPFLGVSDAFRRQGVYTAIIDSVHKSGKALGAVIALSGTSVANNPVLANMSKTGRNMSWYRLKKEL